ncbi:MAG TPA: transposase, partial [Chthonomonadaceae bacterium]|nr:transposase [Chthonomonadaceae bacterium]
MSVLLVCHLHRNRIWFAFQVGEKREHLLAYAHGQADLKRYGKAWFLFQTLDVPEAELQETTNHLGVDVGICTVASSNDGKQTLRFPGEQIRRVRSHHHQLRRGLQRHKTKSSRRRVRKLRDKESRTVRTYNHLISRRIIQQAQRTNSTKSSEGKEDLGCTEGASMIVLEALEGI